MNTPVKVLARGWKLEVKNDASQWVKVNGLHQLGFDSDKSDVDTTTFDDEGSKSHMVGSRGKSIALSGFYLEDPEDGSRDPGQLVVEAIADKIGAESLGDFRLTSPAGTVREFKASANVTGFGGGKDDPSGWTCDITVSGKANLTPVVPTAVVISPDVLALSVGQVSAVPTLTFTPGNSSDQSVTYSSDNAAIAAVTPEGRVIGVAVGSATITVTTVSGSVTDTVAVTVS